MKKKLPFLLLASFLSANEAELQQQINQLRQELEMLKQHEQVQQEEQDEISDIAERAEANTYADKIKFGLGYKLYLDNFDKSYTDKESVSSDNVWSMKLMLNATAKIADNMKFYGRFSMYKYWGSTYVHPYSSYDNMQARVPADSGLYVERAYLDWFMFQNTVLPVALTIGRQPSGDGPSHQFKDNVTRKATYSALLYDGASDGAVVTLNLSHILNYDKTYFRVGYAKGYGYTATGNVGNAYIGASNNDLEDTNVLGFFLDTTLPGIKNSLVQFSYSKMFDIVANPLDYDSDRNTNIGDVELYGAMVEIENLKNWNLDLFIHYAYSTVSPNGNGYSVESNGQIYDFGGLLSQTGDVSTKSGHAFWIGGRYGFGEKAKYKLGVEYNHASRYWISLTQGAFDVYNKLATRGDGYEGYLMYVINRYANIRAGYVRLDYEYTGSGWFIGNPQKVEDVSGALQRLESYYLKMSVNF